MFNTVKEAYDKYIVMDNRLNTIEDRISKLENTIRENEHTGRICPQCGQKTLHFPYKKSTVAGGNYLTGEVDYTTVQKLVAVCQSCGWEYDNPDFINDCLHHL